MNEETRGIKAVIIGVLLFTICCVLPIVISDLLLNGLPGF